MSLKTAIQNAIQKRNCCSIEHSQRFLEQNLTAIKIITKQLLIIIIMRKKAKSYQAVSEIWLPPASFMHSSTTHDAKICSKTSIALKYNTQVADILLDWFVFSPLRCKKITYAYKQSRKKSTPLNVIRMNLLVSKFSAY